MRFLTVVAVALALGGPAVAQDAQLYRAAEAAFINRSVTERLNIQLYLTAAGYWSAVPNVSFGNRLFRAIAQFQSTNGFTPTGELNEDQLERLRAAASPMLDLWGFKAVPYPGRSEALWVPFGLGLNASRDEYGPVWQDPNQRVKISYSLIRNSSPPQLYDALIEEASKSGATVHYKIIKPNFLAISLSRPNGLDSYIRFQRSGTNLIGFNLLWQNREAQLHIERVATLMSGSLWAAMTPAPFPAPPIRQTLDASVTRPAPPPTPAPPPSSTPKAGSTSGTGFFVSADGFLLTNAHVVEECTFIEITADKQTPKNARLVAKDVSNDLALLKLEGGTYKPSSLRVGIRLGDPIAVFGFPLSNILSSSGNFTLGNVTALSGIRDDSRFLQVSAPVQPGNSGGPLLDHSGNVAGVVTSKLNALKTMLSNDGDIPQNVNFAIKSTVAVNFLESNRVPALTGQAGAPLAPADLADSARQVSAFVKCTRF